MTTILKQPTIKHKLDHVQFIFLKFVIFMKFITILAFVAISNALLGGWKEEDPNLFML